MAIIEAIATTYCEDDVAYVDFTGIGTDYEHLQIRASGRAYASGVNNHWWGVKLQTSGGWGTSANYAYHMVYGSGTTEAGGATATGSDAFFQFNGSLGNDDTGTTAYTDRAAYASIVLDILDYHNADKNTSVSALAGSAFPYSTTGLGFNSGLLVSKLAITGVRIGAYNGLSAGSTLRGSVFSLYGLKSAN